MRFEKLEVTVHRTLIVARLKDGGTDGIAEAFAASDAGDLPHRVGVSRRTLFRFHDLYFHLVEAADDISSRLYDARDAADYKQLSEELTAYVRPYDPNWKEPKDAMAEPFYIWTPEQGRIR